MLTQDIQEIVELFASENLNEFQYNEFQGLFFADKIRYLVKIFERSLIPERIQSCAANLFI